MSLALCVYDLTIGIRRGLDAFTKIANDLGLSDGRVLVQALEQKWLRRMPLGRSGSVDSFFSEMRDFGFTAFSGDNIDDLNAAMLGNSGTYVCYTRAANRDSITVFSPEQADSQSIAGRLMPGLPAKYGFGMDWNRPGSFFGYANGFSDFQAVGGNLLGTSEAGRWGVLYLQSEPFFDTGYFRDIYPANLLTSAHLKRETPDGTVRELILGHADWGSVTPLADNWFLWSVPLNEIDNVRKNFRSRGLLESV